MATTPKDKRKRRVASGGIQTCDVLRTRQTLYQLSHQGSSAGQAESLNVIQGQRHLFSDKQGNSFSVLCMYVCMTLQVLMYMYSTGQRQGITQTLLSPETNAFVSSDERVCLRQ